MAVASARPSGPSGSFAPSSSTPSVNRSRSCVCSASSSTVNRAATLASNGNWWRSRVQKAWMVCTLSPPGVSSARANSRRARARRAASGITPDLVADHVVERGVVERGPGRERVEHALGHIGGGGLGEGDAEDFLRFDIFKQQVDHALRQHMGFARAGIGGEPRRHFRIGRRPLSPAHVFGNGVWRSHWPPRCRCRRSRRRYSTIPSRARDGRSRRNASATSDARASGRVRCRYRRPGQFWSSRSSARSAWLSGVPSLNLIGSYSPAGSPPLSFT